MPLSTDFNHRFLSPPSLNINTLPACNHCLCYTSSRAYIYPQTFSTYISPNMPRENFFFLTQRKLSLQTLPCPYTQALFQDAGRSAKQTAYLSSRAFQLPPCGFRRSLPGTAPAKGFPGRGNSLLVCQYPRPEQSS